MSNLRGISSGCSTRPPSVISVPPNTWFNPRDINNRGQIIGFLNLPDGQTVAPSIWRPEGVFTRLDSLLSEDSPWELTEANAINDRGQIVGRGWLNDQMRGFLLTPIPEPSTTTLGIIGIFVVAVCVVRPRMRRRVLFGYPSRSRNRSGARSSTLCTKAVHHGSTEPGIDTTY